MLAHLTGGTRPWLLAHPDDMLGRREREAFAAAVERRAGGEPVAYILGWKEWYGRRFDVSPAVLVPRPETELVLEAALRLAGRMRCRSVADVGTGSGAIAVTMALELPGCHVYATDISPAALQVAARNVGNHGVEGRVDLLPGNLLQPLRAEPDLIVANLPYLSAEDMATLSPEVRHEPASALDGGRDGMHLLGALVQQVAERRWRCRLVLEIGATQGPPFVELARSLLPSARVTIERDLAGLDRVAIVEPNGSE